MSVGVELPYCLSLEQEIDYLCNRYSVILGEGENIRKGTVRVHNLLFLTNLVVRFPEVCTLRPYVGGGVGVDLHRHRWPDGSSANNRSCFAAHCFVGLLREVNLHGCFPIEVGAQYRALYLDRSDLLPKGSHSLELVVRRHF